MASIQIQCFKSENLFDGGRRDGGGMAKKMGPVSERKAHILLLSECQFQAESSVIRGNTLHYTDGHGPRGIQGEIAQAGTGQGLSN